MAAIGLMEEQDFSESFSVMINEEATNFTRKTFSEDDGEQIKFEGKDYFIAAKMGTGNSNIFRIFSRFF